jgi:hypothetical protein
VLNEHNYGEFKRSSQLACLPGGSHGIRSPWCACFRRCYSTWDTMYEKWLNDIKDGSSTFQRSDTTKMKPCCSPLSNGIQNILKLHQKDMNTFKKYKGNYNKLVQKINRDMLNEAKNKEKQELQKQEL